MTLPKEADPKVSETGSLSSLEATGTYAAPAAAAAAAVPASTGSHPQLNTKPLFKLMVEKKASDLFFTSNAPIKIKIEGQILAVNKQVLTPETVKQTAYALDRDSRKAALARFLRKAVGEPLADSEQEHRLAA